MTPDDFDLARAGQPTPTYIAHVLPFSGGVRARLVLPEDLTQADAERITAFVTALAFNEGQS